MSSIGYLFDERFHIALALGLRRRGVEVRTPNEAGLHSAPDSAYLERCRETGSVLVTHDQDFLRLDAEGVEHRGIVFCAHGSKRIGQMIEVLYLIYAAMESEEFVGRVEFV